jgi:hypothetical protein
MRSGTPFSAQAHDIAPRIELMPMAQVNEAIRRLKENKARYRIVLLKTAEPFTKGQRPRPTEELDTDDSPPIHGINH